MRVVYVYVRIMCESCEGIVGTMIATYECHVRITWKHVSEEEGKAAEIGGGGG